MQKSRVKTKSSTLKKIVVITGPTASGKSDLGVRLAQKFNGEIISADSRQIYRGLDVGTGKITKKEMCGVRHHLLSITTPKKEFSVAEYRSLAEKAIEDIQKSGKTPFIVGGTGFYIDALLGRAVFPEVPPNNTLRKKLEKKSVEALFALLKKKDPRRAKNIDPHNKIRLVRALEIADALGSVPNLKKKKRYQSLEIGILTPHDVLQKNIRVRLQKRLPKMLTEVRRLHHKGLSWKRMYQLGLEYRFVSQYLQKKLTKDKMVELLNTAIWQYARRQKTWFKQNKSIEWFPLSKEKQIEKKVAQFLKK
jgi:tRNA dimethylallyltransferase